MELNNILYIEDDPHMLDLVTYTLEDGGFFIQPCSTPDEALSAIDSFKPDLILSDVVLPGKTGPELLYIFRQIPELLNIPAIFLTSSKELIKLDNHDISFLEPFETIQKPIMIDSFVDDVREAWQQIIIKNRG